MIKINKENALLQYGCPAYVTKIERSIKLKDLICSNEIKEKMIRRDLNLFHKVNSVHDFNSRLCVMRDCNRPCACHLSTLPFGLPLKTLFPCTH